MIALATMGEDMLANMSNQMAYAKSIVMERYKGGQMYYRFYRARYPDILECWLNDKRQVASIRLMENGHVRVDFL